MLPRVPQILDIDWLDVGLFSKAPFLYSICHFGKKTHKYFSSLPSSRNVVFLVSSAKGKFYHLPDASTVYDVNNLKKLLQENDKNTTKKDIIELLEKEKCEIFEIFEWPEILQVEMPHIQERISFLKERGVPVSVGHLKCACGRSLSFPQLLRYYHLETQGHKSIGESLMKSFGLSQEEVMRLMSNKSVRKSTILKKLKLLTEYGFRKDQITARIIRYNAKEIRRRCEEMSSAGINPPRKQYLSLRIAEFNRRIRQLTQDKTNENVADQVSTSQIQSKKSHSENYHLENTVRQLKITVNDAVQRNFRLLEEEDCQHYEIFEWPDVLHLDTKQLRERISVLKREHIPVSVGRLRCINEIGNFAANSKNLKQYSETTHGHRSIGQFLIHELGCDEKTVVELLSRREDNSVRKFIVLRKNGLEAQNILGGLNTVTRHSVEELQYRCEYLKSRGQQPTEMCDIGAADSRRKFKSRMKFKKPWYVKQMADLLGISAGPKHEIQKFAAEKSLSSLRYLLIEKKYSTDDILKQPDVLNLSVHQLQSALASLEAMISKRPIPLDALVSFRGVENTFQHSGLLYAKKKFLMKTEIQGIQERAAKITNVSNKDIKLNFFYLIHECKINAKDIETLPYVLLHDPAALKLHWHKLLADIEPKVLSSLYEKPERLLNLLQYYLEKNINFRHIYVLKDNTEEYKSGKPK